MRFLPPKTRGHVAVAICDRCSFKVQYDDLVKDPDTGMMVCGDCRDMPDPYKLPARKTEDISLAHPRPDVELENG